MSKERSPRGANAGSKTTTRLAPHKSYAAKTKDPLRRPERRNASGNLIAPVGQKNFSNAKALPQHALHLERLLPELLSFEQPADRVVSRYFRAEPQLGNRDRALIAESAFAILRRKNEFSQFASSGEGSQPRRLALLGLLSALSEGGLGSANRMESAIADLAHVLKPGEYEWLQRFATIDPATLSPLVRNNLPEWLWDAFGTYPGEDSREALAKCLMRPALLDLRANTMKTTREQLLAEMNALGGRYQAIPTPYSPDGVRIMGKPALQNTVGFKAGMFEVQDEGSQLLSYLLAPKRGEMVVDFCAGAGGKTLAIGALMRSTGRLYALDTSERRLANLKPRQARSGLSNVHPVWIDSENDAKIKRLAGKIDRVLVDAPCSGMGTLRRNPDLKWRQTPTGILELNEKQTNILASASRLLKPGGRLVYATCSLMPQENQAIAEDFLAKHPDFEVIPAAQALKSLFPKDVLPLGCSPDNPWWQLWPHIHDTDGFFGAIFQRKAAVIEKKLPAEECAPDAEKPKKTKKALK
ncbi:16S rRNA (cytosine967-C5)-methyltransferase [Polynucleobacter meluiroseus]|uniref:16S rRNA (Cytosine967-C5)-methyltransferase n=1 Tax=Polynucleobacter meluiroseus TaxID=1938814 RepID=A0A240DZF3_9BURK|nr:RsmB/NOP family class I SAM-dependent RNA methyltransferase [Polynucleobacter meluiroseus]SNX28000.1 16S rRNA (cytosine967-C5)-methyltransferase [Polynucleobacter meluiroseus]